MSYKLCSGRSGSRRARDRRSLGAEEVDKAAPGISPKRLSPSSYLDRLSSKLFANGGFRDSAKIVPLLPSGGAGLKAKVPKRKDYGAEGEAGDAAHASAMKEFGIKEFGASHVKGETMNTRMKYVGLFGHWLQLNEYGQYVQWHMRASKNMIRRTTCASKQRG